LVPRGTIKSGQITDGYWILYENKWQILDEVLKPKLNLDEVYYYFKPKTNENVEWEITSSNGGETIKSEEDNKRSEKSPTI
jgi:hypothetical protein